MGCRPGGEEEGDAETPGIGDVTVMSPVFSTSGPLASRGASATSARSTTSSLQRRKSPAAVIWVRPRPEFASSFAAAASSSAARWTWRAPVRALADLDALEDLPLQGRAEALHLRQSVRAGGGLELGERADAELAIELHHLVRPQSRDGQHFEDAGRNFAADLLERRMGSCLVQLLDHVGDGLADPGDRAQAAFPTTASSGEVSAAMLSAARA